MCVCELTNGSKIVFRVIIIGGIDPCLKTKLKPSDPEPGPTVDRIVDLGLLPSFALDKALSTMTLEGS